MVDKGHGGRPGRGHDNKHDDKQGGKGGGRPGGGGPAGQADPPSRKGAKAATPLTERLNAAVQVPTPASDTELKNAQRGLLYQLDKDFTVFKGEEPIWTLKGYDEFLDRNEGVTAPPEVNPSLWRNASLNMNVGVYEAVPGAVYQVRGVDLSNITFIEEPGGTNRVVVVDPLVSAECAERALELYQAAREAQKQPKRTISAVIFTHSHVDHYGGVRGLFPDGYPGQVPIYGPDGFLDHVVSENVYAGVAMSRRATFMYGVEVPKASNGQVDAGLGKTTSVGTVGFLTPTVTIKENGQVPIGGLLVDFQLTPDTEAPSEMNFYLPQYDALCLAENATPTLHNIYSLRGAQVRDAKAWSQYLNQTIEDYGDQARYLFASHFWPRWKSDGGNEIVAFLTKQADMYRYLHDQTLHWANQGETLIEIAEHLELPESLADEWYNRGYYGTMNHNIKAVYQRYLGWYDGNPANLNPLTPSAAGARYVKALGGPVAVLELAGGLYEEAQSQDDYRWIVELLNHLVFGDPGNTAARELQADVLEQLGYLAESGPWRNFYLAASDELRVPIPPQQDSQAVHPDVVAAMPVESIWDYLGIRLNAQDVAGASASMAIAIVNGLPLDDDKCVVRLRNSVIVYSTKPQSGLQATYTLDRTGLDALALGQATPASLLAAGLLTIQTGTLTPLTTITANLTTFKGNWPIARP